MDDERLDEIIRTAGHRYRTPPAPDLDRLWQGIEAARSRPAVPRWRRWATPLAIAATAAIAFSLGRATTPSRTDVVVASAAPATGPAPVIGVANDLLGQTVILLSTMPGEPAGETQAFARQAGELLATTRLLLDAPDTQRNPALAGVLRDLELVLAQAARLRGPVPTDELDLITDALREQDLVPRIRTVAAGLQAGD
jgi:hypothetical protein